MTISCSSLTNWRQLIAHWKALENASKPYCVFFFFFFLFPFSFLPLNKIRAKHEYTSQMMLGFQISLAHSLLLDFLTFNHDYLWITACWYMRVGGTHTPCNVTLLVLNEQPNYALVPNTNWSHAHIRVRASLKQEYKCSFMMKKPWMKNPLMDAKGSLYVIFNAMILGSFVHVVICASKWVTQMDHFLDEW